jgi:PAS domain S-box-containing protein
MRTVFNKLANWLRFTHRTGYLRPIIITIAVTAVIMVVYKAIENRLFPRMTMWGTRVTSILISCAITGSMAYLALRLYRQMAQDTIDELTERLRLSEELLEERNLVKSLMESTVDRIYFKDLDGRFIRASVSVAKEFGLAHPSEVIGRSDFDFFAEECARQIRREEQEVLRTGEPIIGRACREIWRDGRETWASVTIVPLRERHGRVIGTLGIARDITASRAQEQRVRQLSRAVEQSPDMVLITDRHGAIEYVNPRFCEITGYQPEELLGRNPRLLRSGAHDAAFFQHMWGAVLSGQEWRGELLNRRKNGELFWTRACISPIRNGAGEITHLVSVAEDITKEKEAEAAIFEEQRRRRELERIISLSPAIVFLWRNELGWPVEYVSDNVDQWGYTVGELTSGTTLYSSLIHPDDVERVASEVRHYTEGGIDNFIKEYRILQANGDVRWVEDRTWLRRNPEGVITHFQGIVLDITERKQAEAAQQALLKGLRTVLDIADDLIACPSEDALYLRAVELARERLGLERCGILIVEGNELRGTYGTGLNGETTDEHQHRFPLNDMWRARLRFRGPTEERWTLVTEPRWVWRGDHMEQLSPNWIALTPIQSSTQDVIGVLCNDAAITEAPPDRIVQEIVVFFCSLLGNMVARKRAEEEQQRSRIEQREFMERADRLNSLGLLAAGMAHEINNPLQGMMSHLRAVERALPVDAKERANLKMVERGIESIAGLVRKLLYLGTTEKVAEIADARECVEFVVQLLAEPLKRARIKIVSQFPDARMLLAMPRRELIQVLLNLIINARDAMPTGGEIHVSANIERDVGTIRISDTGPGIPPEIVDRIFLPFFTTKGTKGTGLGLSVAESLVRGNRGKIRVESSAGQGATFIVSLPLA